MPKKLPPIPITEWITLAIGIILFAAIEGLLLLYGYSDLLINTAVAFVVASITTYGIFGMKNKALPKLIMALGYWLGVVLLNLAMIPVMAVYLTIYGMIFSLSGATAKILLRHYDALGKRMTAPIEEYLYLETVVSLIIAGVIVVVAAEILNGLQTASSITASNAANFSMTGESLTTMGTFISYLPVLAIVVIIAIVIILVRFFLTGAQGFSASPS